MYRLMNDDQGNLIGVVNTNTWLSIPINTANIDYQEYLAWLAEGNEPLPADD